MLMALLLRWLMLLVLMLLQILGELLYRKRRVAWSARGRISSGPFRSTQPLDLSSYLQITLGEADCWLTSCLA
jgi:hypothetical protein